LEIVAFAISSLPRIVASLCECQLDMYALGYLVNYPHGGFDSRDPILV
jgi:hypothetical protein